MEERHGQPVHRFVGAWDVFVNRYCGDRHRPSGSVLDERLVGHIPAEPPVRPVDELQLATKAAGRAHQDVVLSLVRQGKLGRKQVLGPTPDDIERAPARGAVGESLIDGHVERPSRLFKLNITCGRSSNNVTNASASGGTVIGLFCTVSRL